MTKREKIVQQGLRVLDVEAQSVLSLKKWVNDEFVKAVEAILACQGKLVVSGMGKSGHISRKIASTFASTGTPSVYLHPAEASHGDLGIISGQDVVMAVSSGGQTAELGIVLERCARLGVPVIALTGQSDSLLGRNSQIFVSTKVAEEACPLGIAPTASSTAALAMGDALAMAVLDARGFLAEDFAALHPGGSLGFRLTKRVKDFMHTGQGLPFVGVASSMKDVFSAMTHRDVRGVVGVIDQDHNLLGVITDGDIRRKLDRDQGPFSGTAQELMTKNPRTIDANELAEKALFFMDQFRVQFLFVLDQSSDQPRKPVGIIHFLDLLNAKVR